MLEELNHPILCDPRTNSSTATPITLPIRLVLPVFQQPLKAHLAARCRVNYSDDVMNRLSLAERDIKKLRPIARAILDGIESIEGIDLSNKHKQVDLLCQASGYRNLHDVQAEIKRNGDPVPPAPASISRYDLQMRLARGLQRIVHTLSDGNQTLNLIEALQRVARADLEPLTIYKSSVEYLHTQRLMTDASKRELPDLALAAARRQAEIEQCWTPDRDRLIESGAPPFMVAISYDPMLPTTTATVHHWQTAKTLYNAVLAATDDRDLPPEVSLKDLRNPERMSRFLEHVVVQGSNISIEDFVAQYRIPYHEVIWLFSEGGEYIGRVLRNTVHGGIVAGLLHTDEDVLEGKACLLLNEPLTRIHNRHYEFFEEHGTLPVFTLKPGLQSPRSVLTLQDRPQVDAKDLVRVPNIQAGYLLLSNVGGTRVHEKAWQIKGRSIYVYPERARNFMWSVSYYETERWLEESDFPELFRDPRPANHDDVSIGTANKTRTFLPTYATDLQDRATFLLNSELNGRTGQEKILAISNRLGGAERKLKAQAERIAAVKTYVQEVKELDKAAAAGGYAYLYGPVSVTEPESLKLVKRR